jgi:hypothetical protein
LPDPPAAGGLDIDPALQHASSIQHPFQKVQANFYLTAESLRRVL